MSALALRVGAPDGVAPPTWTGCSRACSSTSCRWYRRGSDFSLPPRRCCRCWPTWTTTSAPGWSSAWCRSAHRALGARSAANIADVVTTAAKLTMPRWRARDHDRRARVPQPRCECVVGAGRQRGSRGGLPAAAQQRRPWCSGWVAADQLSIRRGRRPVHDHCRLRVRRNWARVAEVVGEPDSGAATVHGVTSLPMMAERDPWVNMLRTTLAAFGAGVGGADTVLVQPFDVAIPGGFPGSRPASRGGSPATPSCCCWRNPMSGGCSIPRPGRGSLTTSPSARRAGVDAFPGDRAAGRLRRGRGVRRRADRRGARPPDRRHRAPGRR